MLLDSTFAKLQPIMDSKDVDEVQQMPDWLTSALHENQWRKGRIGCPTCSGKIGSFNFITPQKCSCGRQQAPLIYLYNCKIDICIPTDIFAALRNNMAQYSQRVHVPITENSAAEGSYREVGSNATATSSSATSSRSLAMPDFKVYQRSHSWDASGSASSVILVMTAPGISHHLDVAESKTKPVSVGSQGMAKSVAATTSISPGVRQGHRKTHSWSGSIKTTISTLLGGIFSSGMGNNQPVTPATPSLPHPLPSAEELDNDDPAVTEMESLILEPDAALFILPKPTTDGTVRNKRIRAHVAKSTQNPSRSLSLVSLIPDYLLCSICLDIFCLPRYCLPCRHVFCEPCLKLLAHSSIMPRCHLRTLCPLCRQLIRWTEPASDLHAALRSSEWLAKRYSRRVSEYRVQPSILMLKLPGIYHLRCIRQIVGCLPDALARRVETLWVDYTPLVTLYSFCVSLLCLLFFFTLFLPCVYLTSWIGKSFENFSSSNELGVWVIYQEVLDFGALIISSGMISLGSIIVVISIALYTLFVM